MSDLKDDLTEISGVGEATADKILDVLADHDTTAGDEVMSVQAAYAGARLVRDLREVTPHPDERKQNGTQSGLAEFDSPPA